MYTTHGLANGGMAREKRDEPADQWPTGFRSRARFLKVNAILVKGEATFEDTLRAVQQQLPRPEVAAC
jgi:hypothetical protein